MKALATGYDRPRQAGDLLKKLPKSARGSMAPTKPFWFTSAAVVVFLLAFGLVAQFATPLNSKLISSAAALTIITASAVGIERAIEAFWTYIGLTKGSWWPLGPVQEQFDGLISGLDASFDPFYEDAQAKMQQLQRAGKWSEDKLKAAGKDLEMIKRHVEELRKLPIDSQRVRLTVSSASRSVEYFSKRYDDLKEAAGLADLAIQGLTNFVDTFRDNPGRRLISLFAGSLIGLVIAGVIGLDIFEAVLQTSISAQQGIVLPHVGVAITGLLIGLGANPTHEAIRLLQEVKKLRIAENVRS